MNKIVIVGFCIANTLNASGGLTRFAVEEQTNEIAAQGERTRNAIWAQEKATRKLRKTEEERNSMIAALALCAGTVAVRQLAGDEHRWVQRGATVAAVPACLLAGKKVIETLLDQ